MSSERARDGRGASARLGSIRASAASERASASASATRGKSASAGGGGDRRATTTTRGARGSSRERRERGEGATRANRAGAGERTRAGERTGEGEGEGEGEGAASGTPRRAGRAARGAKETTSASGGKRGKAAIGGASTRKAASAVAVKEEAGDAATADDDGEEDGLPGKAPATPSTPARAADAIMTDAPVGVQTTPARQARMSKAKQAQLALEEASRRIQPERATTEEMYDAEEDWTDKSQYYPTVLTRSSREVDVGAVGDTVRESTEDKYVVLQLPSDLPLRKRIASEEMDVDGVVTLRDDDPDDEDSGMVRGVSELSNGQLGELKIHADGSAKLYIGNAVFDVMRGTPYQHSEQLARLDGDRQQCVIMGPTIARMTCVPDVTQLLL